MKYFRHAALLFWVLVTVALGATAWAALSVTPTTTSSVKPAMIGAPATADLRGPALRLLEQVTGSYRSAAADDFVRWSAETVSIARTGASQYVLAGGDTDSPLALAWAAAVEAAVELATTDPSDRPVLIERTARLNLAAHRVATLATGPQTNLTAPSTTTPTVPVVADGAVPPAPKEGVTP